MKEFVVFITDEGDIGVRNDANVSNYDIYRACHEVSLVMERNMVVEQTVSRIVNALRPVDSVAEFKGKILDALKERQENDVR